MDIYYLYIRAYEKGYKMKELDTTLLTILLASTDNNHFVHNMRYLLNADVLNKDEEKVCYNILKQIEMYGSINVTSVLHELAYKLDDIENCEILNYASMFTTIDEFIRTRREEENKALMKEAIESGSPQLYTDKMLETFFNRYANNITVHKDNDYEDLSEPESIIPSKTISSANEYIDDLIGGMEEGSITTIVGTYDYYKSLWAINIAYKSLKSGMNVLYLSLGTKRIEVYKRFLSRHSCDSKFGEPISVDNMNSKCDRTTYDGVYLDFEATFKKHLTIYDDNEFVVNSHYNLQRLIVYAQKEFLEKTNKGIELIVIDDFSNIKLDNGKRSITNRSNIINEYYKYLHNQAKDLLGTGARINIVITLHAINNFDYFFTNCCDFSLDFVDNEVNMLSDYIFTIYVDKNLRMNDNAKLKLLKSYDIVMEESKSEFIDYEHWHLKYAQDNNDDEAHKDELISMLKEKNEKLEEEANIRDKEMMDIVMNRTPLSGKVEVDLDDLLKDYDIPCK